MQGDVHDLRPKVLRRASPFLPWSDPEVRTRPAWGRVPTRASDQADMDRTDPASLDWKAGFSQRRVPGARRPGSNTRVRSGVQGSLRPLQRGLGAGQPWQIYSPPARLAVGDTPRRRPGSAALCNQDYRSAARRDSKAISSDLPVAHALLSRDHESRLGSRADT